MVPAVAVLPVHSAPTSIGPKESRVTVVEISICRNLRVGVVRRQTLCIERLLIVELLVMGVTDARTVGEGVQPLPGIQICKVIFRFGSKAVRRD